MAARRFRRPLTAALIAYGVLMLWLLFFQRVGWWEGFDYRTYLRESVNLRPFYTIINFFRAALHNHYMLRPAVVNIVGNIVMFLPLGFLLPGLMPRLWRLWKLLGTSCLILLLVETIQLFTMTGSWDIDDIILNLAGVALGRAFWTFLPFRDWIGER